MLTFPTYRGMNGLGEEAVFAQTPNLSLKTVGQQEAEMAALDCGFLEIVTNDGHGGPIFCGKPGPQEMLMGLLLAPLLVPIHVADGIVSKRPAKRWLTPMGTDKTVLLDAVGLGGDLGLGGIPVLIVGGLVSLYLWYKIYGALTSKGGS